MMLARRLQVLADGQEIDIGRAQIVHQLQDFVPLLAEADHDAGLGEHRGIEFLDPLQQADRMEIARARPHGEIVRRHRFEIVVEDVGPRRDDRFERAVLAQEVRRQHLDRRSRAACADSADGVGEMLRAAIVEIVAIDRGDDDVGKPELGGGVGDMLRLGGIERLRASRS